MKRALIADASGNLLEASGGDLDAAGDDAAAMASAIHSLVAAGMLARRSSLEMVWVKGPRNSMVVAVRGRGFLLVEVDPEKPTAPVENVLKTWTLPKSAPSLESRGARAKNGAANAMIHGKLGALALPDLLDFLRGGRRTGLLVCTSPAGVGSLHFRGGMITDASSPGTPAVPEGLGDADALRRALEQKIERALRELLRWEDGQFSFEQDVASEPAHAIAVEIDPQDLLLRLFKEQDEASRGPETRGRAGQRFSDA